MLETYLLTNKTANERGYDVSNNTITEFYNQVKNIRPCNTYWYCKDNKIFKSFVGILYRGVLFKIIKHERDGSVKYIIKTVNLLDKIKFRKAEKGLRKQTKKIQNIIESLTYDSIENVLKEIIDIYNDFVISINKIEYNGQDYENFDNASDVLPSYTEADTNK
jgi:hypothetical protein